MQLRDFIKYFIPMQPHTILPIKNSDILPATGSGKIHKNHCELIFKIPLGKINIDIHYSREITERTYKLNENNAYKAACHYVNDSGIHYQTGPMFTGKLKIIKICRKSNRVLGSLSFTANNPLYDNTVEIPELRFVCLLS